ncbi:MAG: FecR family protein [Adhaeribacter sp.]
MNEQRKAFLFQQLIANKITSPELQEFLDSLEETGGPEGYELFLQHHFQQHLQKAAGEENPASGKGNARQTGLLRRPGRARRGLHVAAAGALLLAAGLGLWLTLLRPGASEPGQAPASRQQVSLVEEICPRGRQTSVWLPDSSSVQLNAASKLTYAAGFGAGSRQVKLAGQAFFQVQRDTRRPFVVSAGELRIQVLGTSFGVQAYPGEARLLVTVASGRVKVQGPGRGSQPVYLTRDQQLAFDAASATMSVRTVDARREMSWRQGVLRFERTSLAEVERVLERWYEVDITVADPALYSRQLTGEHTNESLESVLQALSFALNAAYSRQGSTVVLRKKITKP